MSRSLVQRLKGQLLDAAKVFSARYTFAGLQKSIVRQARVWQRSLPYRLVRQDQHSSAALDPLEHFRWALRQPVSTTLPSLGNPLLEEQVFRQPSPPPKKGDKMIDGKLEALPGFASCK